MLSERIRWPSDRTRTYTDVGRRKVGYLVGCMGSERSPWIAHERGWKFTPPILMGS